MKKDLFVALERGDLGTIQCLYDQDPALVSDQRTFQRDAALHIAARQGHLDIVQWILQNIPTLAGVRNMCNETSLIIACKYGHQQIVEQLLDPTETHQSSSDEGADSLLHAAVHGGKVEIVRAILNFRADDRSWHNSLMTKKDKSGRCAIHVAAINDNLDIINEFISTRPDCVDIRSSDHKSVLLFAVQHNQCEIVKNLLAEKSDGKKAELVTRDRDDFQNTALHLAAINVVNLELFHLLLSPTVDVNTVNEEGMTPLDVAFAAGKDNPYCAIIQETLEGKGGKRGRTSSEGRYSKLVNTHMVVASLIATVTFAAIFQIPGGIEDDRNSLQYGGAKLAFHKHFRLFVFSDIVAFGASLSVVFLWLLRQQFENTMGSVAPRLLNIACKVNLVVSIIWTMVAFVTAAISVLIPRQFDTLKNRDHELFSKYNTLLVQVISLALFPPSAALVPLLLIVLFNKLLAILIVLFKKLLGTKMFKKVLATEMLTNFTRTGLQPIRIIFTFDRLQRLRNIALYVLFTLKMAATVYLVTRFTFASKEQNFFWIW